MQQPEQIQLEASQEMIGEGIFVTVNQETNTKIEKDTPFIEKPTKSVKTTIYLRCYRKGQNAASSTKFLEEERLEGTEMLIQTVLV